MGRSSKTKAKRGDVLKSTWLADYAKVSKDVSDAKKSLLSDEASTIYHDLRPLTSLKTCMRLFIALFPVTMLQLILFGEANGVVTSPVTYAIFVYCTELAIGVIGGLPTTADLFLTVMAPAWAMMRGRWGYKVPLTLRTFVLGVIYGGVMLLTVYLAQLAVSNIFATTFNLTIPSRAPGQATTVIYGTVLVLVVAAQVGVAWFDVLGVGDLDGAWLPWSPAKNNWVREQWDRHRYAALQAFSFLVVNQVAGVPMVVNPLYIFATWTQHTNNATNDYPLIFLWTFGTAVFLILGFTLTQVVFTDSVNDLLKGISQVWSEEHMRSKRYGRQHHYERNDDDDEGGEEETESGGEEA